MRPPAALPTSPRWRANWRRPSPGQSAFPGPAALRALAARLDAMIAPPRRGQLAAIRVAVQPCTKLPPDERPTPGRPPAAPCSTTRSIRPKSPPRPFRRRRQGGQHPARLCCRLGGFSSLGGGPRLAPCPARPACCAATWQRWPMPACGRRPSPAAPRRSRITTAPPGSTRRPQAAAVREVLRGIRHTHGTAPARKTPATAELIAGMLAACPNTMIGLRDRALLAFGFAGAFRRSELLALAVADLTESPEGLRVLIRRSKTDQAGEGQEIAIPRGPASDRWRRCRPGSPQQGSPKGRCSARC